MADLLFNRPNKWLFNVRWIGGPGAGASGEGGSGTGPGSGGSSTGGGASGGDGGGGDGGGGGGGPGGFGSSQGFGQSVANALGFGLGQQAPSATFGTDPAVTNSQVAVSFGNQSTAPGTTSVGPGMGQSAANAFGGGGGGAGGAGGGVGTGVGGIGGGSAAEGFGQSGTGGGIGGQGTNPATANLIALASMLGIPPGVLTGVPTATTPIAVSQLGPPSLNPSVISTLNSELAALAAQALPGNFGMNMGFPALEGVSPGLGGFGGSPASPGPSPSTVASNPAAQAIAEAMANAPSTAQGLASGVAGLGPAAQTAQGQTDAATQAPSTTSAQAPSTVSTPTTTATQAPATQSPTGDMSGIFQLVMSLLTGYPPLDNLAQNAMYG